VVSLLPFSDRYGSHACRITSDGFLVLAIAGEPAENNHWSPLRFIGYVKQAFPLPPQIIKLIIRVIRSYCHEKSAFQLESAYTYHQPS